jgi:hypothetical protein
MSAVDVELLVVTGAVVIFLVVTAIGLHRRPDSSVEQGGYQQWLEENRSGINLTCDDCGRDDGSHTPDCPARLLG